MPRIRSHIWTALVSALFIGSSTPLSAQQQDPSFGPTVRWQQDDGASLWVGTDVAIGDHGATVIAAKELNRPLVSVYSAIAGDPLFDHDVPDARQIRVAAASEATTLAAMVQHFRRPGSTNNFQPELWVWEDAQDSEPTWKFNFPEAEYSYYKGMDVHISADGQTIVAWYSYFVQRRVDIRVFNRDGTERANYEAWRKYNSSAGEEATITPDAARMLIDIGGHPRMIDLHTGETIREWDHHSLFAGHAMSADGRVVAVGDDNEVRFFREEDRGRFERIDTYVFDGNRTASAVALDDDGSHAAILIDSWGPGETLDLVVLDIELGQDLDFVRFESPDNYSDLKATGLMMTADAATIVGSTYGDFAGHMPDAFAYTRGEGITAELHTAGSAFASDMDPSGQVLVIATKDKHANTPGAGGDIACADTRPASLRVRGVPRQGRRIVIEVEGAHDAAWIAASTSLGASATPWGIAQLDLTESVWSQRLSLESGLGRTEPHLPLAASAAGLAVHLQAGFLDQGAPVDALTNRVSFRIHP